MAEPYHVKTIEEAKEEVDDWIRQQHHWYVYVLYRPDTMEPFYVGKGTKYRFADHIHAWQIDGNYHKWAIIKKNDGIYHVQFACFCFFELHAYDAEVEVMAELTAQGYKLTNISPGHEGFSSNPFTAEQRRLGVERSTTTNRRPEHVERLTRQAQGYSDRPETRAWRSANISRLNLDPESDLSIGRNAGIRERFLLRREALELLASGRSLPEGITLPENMKVGGRTKFWRHLLSKLKDK